MTGPDDTGHERGRAVAGRLVYDPSSAIVDEATLNELVALMRDGARRNERHRNRHYERADAIGREEADQKGSSENTDESERLQLETRGRVTRSGAADPFAAATSARYTGATPRVPDTAAPAPVIGRCPARR